MAKATIKNGVMRAWDKIDVMELVRKHSVKFIRLWFTDIHGQLKSFAVPVDELEFAFNEGMGFDGSSIKGFARIDESDMIARPDPTTFVILPWGPKERAVGRMFCDIYEPDGSPYRGDPRYVLKINLEKAKQKGFTLYVGPELEYFYFKNDKSTEPLDEGGYFDYPLDAAEDLRRYKVFLPSLQRPRQRGHLDGHSRPHYRRVYQLVINPEGGAIKRTLFPDQTMVRPLCE